MLQIFISRSKCLDIFELSHLLVYMPYIDNSSTDLYNNFIKNLKLLFVIILKVLQYTSVVGKIKILNLFQLYYRCKVLILVPLAYLMYFFVEYVL